MARIAVIDPSVLLSDEQVRALDYMGFIVIRADPSKVLISQCHD